MPKRIIDFKLLDNKQIKKDIFVLDLISQVSLPEILPGQFVQVRIDGSPGTLLRRPFSVHDTDYDRNMVRLLIQVVGTGTASLCSLSPGDTVNLILPLGNYFSLPPSGSRVLLVGGGCGIAPLLYLAKYLKSEKYDLNILTGFRNKDRIIEYDEYEKYGKVFISTEDGSVGEKGMVTDHSVLAEKYDAIYCCGPDQMMKAVSGYARDRNIFCEVSLENLMACGIGICLCCVVRTTRGNVCSCTDGPVFNINDLTW